MEFAFDVYRESKGGRLLETGQLLETRCVFGDRVLIGDRVANGDRVVIGNRMVNGDRVIIGDRVVSTMYKTHGANIYEYLENINVEKKVKKLKSH